MKKLKNKLFYINSIILYLILIFIVSILSRVFVETDMASYLIKTAAARNTGTDNNAIIVIVDQNTLNSYGSWNRAYTTKLLDYFYTYAHPKVIGLDSMISNLNPQNSNDVQFLNQVKKMNNLVVSFTPSQNISESATINMKEFEDKYSLNITNEIPIDSEYQNISKVEQPFMDSPKNFASVLIQNEQNSGTNFETSNIIKIKDKYYPSLPFKMYLVANSTNDVRIDGNFITVPKTSLKIPLDGVQKGQLQTNIRYYRYPTYQKQDGSTFTNGFTHFAISASQILDIYNKLKSGKELSEEEKQIHAIFDKNTPVFIGEFVDGPNQEPTDILNTPLSKRHPGVDVQATIYSNLENNDFIQLGNDFTKYLFIILLTGFTLLCIFKFKFITSLILLLSADALLFLITFIAGHFGYILYYFPTPIAIQLVTLIFGYSFKFISENRNKEKIKQAMGKYLSKDIMQNVVSNIDDLKLGGKRAVVTVIFSDIRGFTSLSEKMTAEEVSIILNEYFAEMEPIISKYNGVINKFIGDAVMAIFGEPIQDINHPQNAVKCAYEMLKKVEYLREKWLFEGKPKIEIGVGINTGEVFIGNIGTENRMEYTVIGDTVNLASRIESYNKVYKTNLLVSASTYSHIADIADVIKISEVQIRGKAKKMNIYEVLRIDKNR